MAAARGLESGAGEAEETDRFHFATGREATPRPGEMVIERQRQFHVVRRCSSG